MLKGSTEGEHCARVVFVLLLAGDVRCIKAAAAIAALYAVYISRCLYMCRSCSLAGRAQDDNGCSFSRCFHATAALVESLIY